VVPTIHQAARPVHVASAGRAAAVVVPALVLALANEVDLDLGRVIEVNVHRRDLMAVAIDRLGMVVMTGHRSNRPTNSITAEKSSCPGCRFSLWR
jgi:hypothetical protein